MDKRTFAALLAALMLAVMPATGMAAAVVSPADYQPPPPGDFRSLPWLDAFDELHAKLSIEYGFTEWKEIDWPALRGQYRPLIAGAQAARDFEAYYLALKGYAYSIPDGHVGMSGHPAIDKKHIGGGYGFAAARLSDGKVVVSWVDETSSAYRQGMRPGAELLAWNGLPVDYAVNGVLTVFGSNPATDEDRLNQQVRFLTRAPVGTKITVRYAGSPGLSANASLVAYDDKYRSLGRAYPAPVVSDGLRNLILGIDSDDGPPKSMVEWRLLPGSIGYIKVWGEIDLDLAGDGQAPSTLGLFQEAVAKARDAQAKGLIIDIRNNIGGLDEMVAAMLGSFYEKTTFYEYQYGYHAADGSRVILAAGGNLAEGSSDYGLYILPAEPRFTGPVIALINGKCVSSGEGLALGIRNLPNGETVGFYGTNGSFGMAGGEAYMPGDFKIRWPFGQSLDENEVVQLDSRGGVGGVAPSVRVPMTNENAVRVARGEDVELEYAIRLILERP